MCRGLVWEGVGDGGPVSLREKIGVEGETGIVVRNFLVYRNRPCVDLGNLDFIFFYNLVRNLWA